MRDTVGQNAEQLSELARIFAAAILRLRARVALPGAEIGSESPAASLELLSDTPLTEIHPG